MMSSKLQRASNAYRGEPDPFSLQAEARDLRLRIASSATQYPEHQDGQDPRTPLGTARPSSEGPERAQSRGNRSTSRTGGPAILIEGALVRVEIHVVPGRRGVSVAAWRRDNGALLAQDYLDIEVAGHRDKFLGRLDETLRAEVSGLLEAAAVDRMRGRTDEGRQEEEEENPPDPEELLRTGSLVLDSPDILDLVDRYLRRTQFAGSTVAPKLAYLAVASRLLKRPLNLALAGPSAAGKNFAVSSILTLFPPSAYYELEGASPLALVYSTESFKHRAVVIGEASALHRDGMGASMMRGIIWGGQLRYDTVVDGNAVHLEKEGPTGLITTTTGDLEPELATRIWSVSIADDPRQTREVMRATARKLAGRGFNVSLEDKGVPPEEAFQAAQQWLEVAGKHEVVIPYAEVLAELISPDDVRIRRDFSQLLTLIQTHALLHQGNRARDPQGRVVATLGDYKAIRALVEPVFSASVSSGITQEVRDTVAAVRGFTRDPGQSAKISDVAGALGLTASGAWHRVKKAISGGWIVNDETRPRHPAKLRLGEPLPEEVPALPTTEQAAARWSLETEEGDLWDFSSNVQTFRQPQAAAVYGDGDRFEGLNAIPVVEAIPADFPAPPVDGQPTLDGDDHSADRAERAAHLEDDEIC